MVLEIHLHKCKNFIPSIVFSIIIFSAIQRITNILSKSVSLFRGHGLSPISNIIKHIIVCKQVC